MIAIPPVFNHNQVTKGIVIMTRGSARPSSQRAAATKMLKSSPRISTRVVPTKGGLKVQPVNNPKLTAPIAYTADPGGKLSVRRAPAKGGKAYNPQTDNKSIQASWVNKTTFIGGKK